MGETRQSISKFAVEVDPIENRLAYWFSIRQTFIKIVILINVIKNKHNCSCIYEATFYLKSRSGTEGICKEQDSLMRLCAVCYSLRFFGRTGHLTRFCLIKALYGVVCPLAFKRHHFNWILYQYLRHVECVLLDICCPFWSESFFLLVTKNKHWAEFIL